MRSVTLSCITFQWTSTRVHWSFQAVGGHMVTCPSPRARAHSSTSRARSSRPIGSDRPDERFTLLQSDSCCHPFVCCVVLHPLVPCEDHMSTQTSGQSLSQCLCRRPPQTFTGSQPVSYLTLLLVILQLLLLLLPLLLVEVLQLLLLDVQSELVHEIK